MAVSEIVGRTVHRDDLLSICVAVAARIAGLTRPTGDVAKTEVER